MRHSRMRLSVAAFVLLTALYIATASALWEGNCESVSFCSRCRNSECAWCPNTNPKYPCQDQSEIEGDDPCVDESRAGEEDPCCWWGDVTGNVSACDSRFYGVIALGVVALIGVSCITNKTLAAARRKPWLYRTSEDRCVFTNRIVTDPQICRACGVVTDKLYHGHSVCNGCKLLRYYGGSVLGMFVVLVVAFLVDDLTLAAVCVGAVALLSIFLTYNISHMFQRKMYGSNDEAAVTFITSGVDDDGGEGRDLLNELPANVRELVTTELGANENVLWAQKTAPRVNSTRTLSQPYLLLSVSWILSLAVCITLVVLEIRDPGFPVVVMWNFVIVPVVITMVASLDSATVLTNVRIVTVRRSAWGGLSLASRDLRVIPSAVFIKDDSSFDTGAVFHNSISALPYIDGFSEFVTLARTAAKQRLTEAAALEVDGDRAMMDLGLDEDGFDIESAAVLDSESIAAAVKAAEASVEGVSNAGGGGGGDDDGLFDGFGTSGSLGGGGDEESSSSGVDVTADGGVGEGEGLLSATPTAPPTTTNSSNNNDNSVGDTTQRPTPTGHAVLTMLGQRIRVITAVLVIGLLSLIAVDVVADSVSSRTMAFFASAVPVFVGLKRKIDIDRYLAAALVRGHYQEVDLARGVVVVE